MRKVGTTPVPPFLGALIYWGLMPYLGMNVPLFQEVYLFCVFSIKLCPIRGKNNDSLGQFSWFDRSYIKALMWRACFKNYTFNLEKGHFWVLDVVGNKCPRPPDSIALDCAPQGQWERFTGTISRFRRSYKGPNVKG